MQTSRRDWLRGLGAAGALAIGGSARADGGRAVGERGLRAVWVNDLHFGADDMRRKGTRELFASIHAIRPAVELVLFGGDIVDGEGDSGKPNWDGFVPFLHETTDLPYLYTLGNHDDGAYSKPDVMDMMGMGRSTAWSRELGGWKFIGLDSHATGYVGHLGDEQWPWLEAELASTPTTTPICVMTHYPILSVTVFFDGDNQEFEGGWKVPLGEMHADARKLKDLFYRHRSVRLCLSGHTHMQDWVEYLGCTYCCGLAASGAWWGGPYYEHPRGYTVYDFLPGGGFKQDVRTY